MKSEILVIDDNADIRFLICNILKEKDFTVRSAANYDQAVIEIKKKIPDLAIIDIKLDKGDKDGIELLKLIMKKNKTTPVIMISGHANVKLAVEAIQIGAYEFVEKPFSTEKILNYVNRGLESSLLKKEKENLENKLFHSFEFINFLKSFDGLKRITFLSEIIFFSNVLGFLPILLFLYLNINVPKLDIFTLPFIISSSKIIDKKSSSKCSETFFEKPNCI